MATTEVALIHEVMPPEEFRRARLESQVRALGLRNPIKSKDVTRVLRDASGRPIKAALRGITDRSRFDPKWTRRGSVTDKSVSKNTSAVPSSFKTKFDNEADILNSYWGWTGILEPEYDLLEPWTLLDVESYYKQSIDRRLALAFRNGVKVTGDNQSFVTYIESRMQQIGFMSRQTFKSLLKEILLNLYVCSNCIVVKIRDEDASGGKANQKNGNLAPVAGYKILPPQTIFPFLDGQGRIEKWRRFFGNGRPYRDYKVEDVCHFYWDRKPGHIFGTPRSTTVRDDIFALRRLEENIELLLVNHLFPLFHVKVGTEKAPADYLPNGLSEIDVVKRMIQDMPKEGVLVTDERTEVEVHGAAKEGIDPNPLLEHYEKRVIAGLGMSPLDLGISDTANRSTADNVSQNLKDSIISDLAWFTDQIEMLMFRDLFAESPTGLSVQNATADVHLEFHEIDVDTQIKKETHAMNAFNNNALTQTEMRGRMKEKPLTDDQKKDIHHELHTMTVKKFDAKTAEKMQDKQLENQKELAKHAAKEQGATARHLASSTKSTKVTRKFANGGSHTKEVSEPTSAAKRAVATKMQPTNQHGKNLDPHKARSSQDPELARALHDSLLDFQKELAAEDADRTVIASAWAAMLFPEHLEIQAELTVYLADAYTDDEQFSAIDAWIEMTDQQLVTN